jgi:cytochrome oxidase Cu insertion factor (SCO1/SenC/PrrC family)
MRIFSRWSAAGVLLAALAMTVWAQPARPRDGNLKVGDAAPDFTVKDVEGKKTVKLSELRGKPVVLIFGSCT